MDIELHNVTIADLVEGYANNEEEGVYGYAGRLNIRPKYQREFVYSRLQQQAVIDTICKRYPLNVMYWVQNEYDTYELLDGQQRTLSICNFVNGEFFIDHGGTLKGYQNFTEEEKKEFLSYSLQIYICKGGTDREKLEWFKTINIAGAQLTDQEIRNAVYPGAWITDAKRHFAKTGCPARGLAEDLVGGKYIRQEVLETVLSWCADATGIGGRNMVDIYMSRHQHDATADCEWQYFQSVVAWVRSIFPVYRREMKGLPWGFLYNKYHSQFYSATEAEKRVAALMLDRDVTNKRGVYEYILGSDERCLSLRAFEDADKREAYERQQGICPHCGKHYAMDEMEADHITPWSQGGRTIATNCQMLCRDCNRRKGGK